MTKHPLVSIVTACYNSSAFIPDMLKSVAIQDYANWEIIIVDDCSEDLSIAVIKKSVVDLKIQAKVTLLENKVNEGYGKTLRKAVSNAKGSLLAIVDSDDALADKDSLWHVVRSHTKYPEVALTYSDYIVCDATLKPIKTYKTRQLLDSEKYIDTKIRISHLKVFKKSFYYQTEGITSRRNTVDKDLVLKLEEVGKLQYLNKPLYKYRRHEKNISLAMDKKPASHVKKVNKERATMYAEAEARRQLNLQEWDSVDKCKSLQEKWGDYDLFAMEGNSQNKLDVLKSLKGLITSQDKAPTILDVGCGTGHYMWAIKDLAAGLNGLDGSLSMMGLAKEQFKSVGLKPRFIHATCWNIPLLDNYVDISYQVDVCMHVGGSWKSILEMIRISKKAVFFTGPSFETTQAIDQIDIQIGHKSFAVNLLLLANNLNKLLGAGEIKSFRFIGRSQTPAYNHRILIIEK